MHPKNGLLATKVHPKRWLITRKIGCSLINLSKRRLSDTDYILLGKGLSFVPKLKSHDKVKLAEEVFRFSRRLRLKEYFYEETVTNEQKFNDKPFFNKKQSTFIPK
jgi:hypothetical protein